MRERSVSHDAHSARGGEEQRCQPRGGRIACGRETNLLADVVQGIGGVDGEANQDDVRVGVRQGPQAVVIFLPGRIPEGQLDVLPINLDIGNIVLEDGGDVDLHATLAASRGRGCTVSHWRRNGGKCESVKTRSSRFLEARGGGRGRGPIVEAVWDVKDHHKADGAKTRMLDGRLETGDVVKLTSGKVPLEKTLGSNRVSTTMLALPLLGGRGAAAAAAAAAAGRPRPARTNSGETHINKQVLPQAPSPTMTSFLRISAAMVAGRVCRVERVGGFGV